MLSQIGRGLVGVAQQWTIGFLLEVLALVDQQQWVVGLLLMDIHRDLQEVLLLVLHRAPVQLQEVVVVVVVVVVGVA